MADPLKPEASVLVKLGSVLVHAEELIEPGGHPFDVEAIKGLISEADIKAWRAEMDAMALLPVKRRPE